jgi:DNA-binding MarR family transcriptional regulator
MKGNLKHFGPTNILNLVNLGQKTGTLQVQRKGGQAALSFKDGKLVYAAMNGTDGSLVSVLQSAGRISEKQGASLAAHAKKHGDKQLGLLLIQKGYISRADIVKCIKRHALSSINEFAKWQEGNWAFKQGEIPGDDRILVPLDLEPVIIQIVRMQKRDKDLKTDIPSLDVILQYTDKSRTQKPDLKLTKDEWRVLRLIKPNNTLQMIANSLGFDDRQIRRIVGSLREAGLVEIVSARRPGPAEMTEEEKEEKKSLVLKIMDRIRDL